MTVDGEIILEWTWAICHVLYCHWMLQEKRGVDWQEKHGVGLTRESWRGFDKRIMAWVGQEKHGVGLTRESWSKFANRKCDLFIFRLHSTDSSIWSILESKACSWNPSSSKVTKRILRTHWCKILRESIRAACSKMHDRLRRDVTMKGGHMENNC